MSYFREDAYCIVLVTSMVYCLNELTSIRVIYASCKKPRKWTTTHRNKSQNINTPSSTEQVKETTVRF